MADTLLPSDASIGLGPPRHRNHGHERTPRAARRARPAVGAARPPRTASTTSLTVPPKTRRTVRISSRGTWAKAKRRWGEMAPLSDVRGARNGAGGGTTSSSSRSRRLRSARSCTAPNVRRRTRRGPLGLADQRRHGRADQLRLGGDRLGPPRPCRERARRVAPGRCRGTRPPPRPPKHRRTANGGPWGPRRRVPTRAPRRRASPTAGCPGPGADRPGRPRTRPARWGHPEREGWPGAGGSRARSRDPRPTWGDGSRTGTRTTRRRRGGTRWMRSSTTRRNRSK